jgi:subtilisin family serine protease/peptidoglycan hydrolase-like protein with peptidoglycan-binding domain/ribosomal protein S28E/S33
MDPGLLELIAAGRPDDEVSVIVRLHPGGLPPPAMRLVARFGDVATGRTERGLLASIHAHPSVASLKAPRIYASEADNPFGNRPTPIEPGLSEADPSPVDTDQRRPPGLAETGRGTVVAVIDWGIDFAHPDFCNARGHSRLLAIWDQRAMGRPAPYGYGRIHTSAEINRALRSDDPFDALDYFPSASSAPAHGTHVMGIAAGNGRAGGPAGVAPEAELIFVHLGPGLGDLGNSVDLLEAIDFVIRTAGNRPVAINMSIGRHAGPHDGTLLIERAIDWLIVNRPGTVVVQSTGNYYSRNVHMEGRLREARTARLPFILPHSHAHPATVELWYKGADRFVARAIAPDGSAVSANPGTSAPLNDAAGQEVARLYHRIGDPNNGDNLVALVLRPMAAAGNWGLEVSGTDIVDGRWHAWIERNAACPQCQATFLPNRASRRTTTGSICNAMRTIAVGAYDAHDPAKPLAVFSSVGPTRDGRQKPLLAAPGVRILSVRSRRTTAEPPDYVRMSGTSMAAPHVTGTAALMLEAAGVQPIASLRRALFSTLDAPPRGASDHVERWGYGILNIEAAVAAAHRLRVGRQPVPVPLEYIRHEASTFFHAGQQENEAMERESLYPFENEPVAAAATPATAPAPAAGALPEPPAPADPAPAAAPEPTAVHPAHDPVPEPSPAMPEPTPAAVEPPDTKTLINMAVNPQVPSTQIVGFPGTRLAVPLIAGDIIVRGRNRYRRRAKMVSRPRVLRRAQLRAARSRRGRPTEAGFYVETISDEGFERIAGPDGLLLPDVTIIRSLQAMGSLMAQNIANQMVPPVVGRPMIRLGSYGPAVIDAQARLNDVHMRRTESGQAPLDRCPLAVDGIFGRNMHGATVAFQQIAFPGQPVEWDGIIGPKTWSALIAASAGTAPAPAPNPIPIDPPHIPVVEPVWTIAENVTPAQIGTNLAAITITSTSVDRGLRPNAVDFNAIAWTNRPSKRRVYSQLEVARRRNAEAQQRLAAARARVPAGSTPSPRAQQQIAAAEAAASRTQSALDRAIAAIRSWLQTNGYAYNRRLGQIAGQRREADRALARARSRRDQTAIQQAEQQISALDSERAAARAEVDRLVAAFVPLVQVTENQHILSVDGETVRLHDNVNAYATIIAAGFEGEATNDSRALVTSRLGQYATGDHLRILSVISNHEGTFTNVNSWDRAIVTWGFIQWTYGEGGDGSLVGLLAEIKRREPQLFENRMQRYGLDVTRTEAQLTKADGTVLTGGAAAAAMQTDAKLMAVLSRLGVEPAVQQIQIEHAITTKITNLRSRRVNGHPVTVGDIVSSSYGVGVMTDRHVGSGIGAVTNTIKRALDTFVASNPGADLTQEIWKAQAETAVVSALAAIDTDRASAYRHLSQARGSFAP